MRFKLDGQWNTSIQAPLAFAEQQGRVLGQVGGGSAIEYGPSGPIFFVSGFVALFSGLSHGS